MKFQSILIAFTLLTSSVFAGKVDKKLPADKPLPPIPELKVVPIDATLQAAAAETLKASLISPNPFIRAHAVEAAAKVYGDGAADAILHAVNDGAPVVRFAGCMAVGDLRLAAGRDDVHKHLADGDPGVQVAVRYALHRLGDVSYSHDLERFARDPEKGVRGNTALVLGKIGSGNGADKILLFLQRDKEATVRLQAGEALWRMGDERGLKTLVAGTVSGYSDDVIVSVLALAGPREQSIRGHLQEALVSEYPEVALAAARGLGQLGHDDGFAVALAGAKSKEAGQRYLAAIALGDIGRVDGQESLKGLLAEKDHEGFPTAEDVRLAAACAALQIGQRK